jgi:CheY-like chemotaxis protein
MMGGNIWMDSQVGEGSRFYFTAQFGIVDPTPALQTVEAGQQASGVTEEERFFAEAKLRVLLAEDNPINQIIAAKTLERQGCFVVIATNGVEAVNAAESGRFDLILMDVQMPVMDGLEALSRIREREKASNERIPIIAMTAHAMKGDEDMCLSAGMDGYIAKPFQAKRLFETIYRVLQSRKAIPEQQV